MPIELTAVLLSAGASAAAGLLGAGALTVLSRRRPVWAALGAPLVVVLALAAGVAAATASMLIGEDNYRTLIFVLLAGAPMAVLVGVLLARRVRHLERAANEQQLEASRRDTIRWLSHDLRTPLAGIRATAELLSENLVDTAVASQRITSETIRLDDMVEEVTALASLQQRPAAQREIVELDDLVSDAVSALDDLARTKQVTVQAGNLAGALIRAHPRDISRALANVLRNAISYTAPGSTVMVSTVAQSGQVAVTVTDSCGGIAATDLPRVCEIGWRGDQARSSHTGGLGLGLAITRQILAIHDGTVQVQNLPDGSGCQCTLSFARQG